MMKTSKFHIFWWVTALTVLISILYFLWVLLTHPDALCLIAGAPLELQMGIDAALLQTSVQCMCAFIIALTAIEAVLWNHHFCGDSNYKTAFRKFVPVIIAAGVWVIFLFLYLVRHKSFPLYLLPLSAAMAACLLIPVLIFARQACAGEKE